MCGYTPIYRIHCWCQEKGLKMSCMWSTKVHMPSESYRTSGMMQKRSVGNQDLVAKGFSVEKWSVHLFRMLLKNPQ
jgi:hypothetical protein